MTRNATEESQNLRLWVLDLQSTIDSLLDASGSLSLPAGLNLSELDKKDIDRRVKGVDQASVAARRMARNAILHKHFPDSHLAIARGPNGKPVWEQRHVFNGSQSGSCFAFVLSSGASIGIDLESAAVKGSIGQLEKKFGQRMKVVDLFFRPDEKAFLAERENTGLEQWHREFLRLWTRKEAAVKCWGTNIESHCFDVASLADSFEWNGRTWFLRTIPVEIFGRPLWLSLCSDERDDIFSVSPFFVENPGEFGI